MSVTFEVTTTSALEQKRVTDAFATSIVWGFTVAAESDGRILIDATDFLMRDAHGVAQRLRPAAYRFERSRSAIFMPMTKNFPNNTEMEVTTTFVTDAPGASPGQSGGRISDVEIVYPRDIAKQALRYAEIAGK